MGNKVLKLFLAAWSVVVPNAPTFLAGRRMGVDVSILAYQALAVEDIRAAVYGGNMLPFVAYFKKWATRLLLWGCTPIFVFDSVTGPTYEPKKEEQERRRTDVLAAMGALQGPLSPEEREKHIKTIVRPTPDLMHLLAEACDNLKVPFLFSPSQTVRCYEAPHCNARTLPLRMGLLCGQGCLATIFMTSKQRKRFKRKREMEAAQQAAQGGVQGDDEVDNHAAGPASPVQVAQNPGPAPPNVGDTEMAALGYKRRRQRTQTND